MAIKYFQWPLNRPNGHKINQDFPKQYAPKFIQRGILGLKPNHLATLVVNAALKVEQRNATLQQARLHSLQSK
jgi:hypothetical protein